MKTWRASLTRLGRLVSTLVITWSQVSDPNEFPAFVRDLPEADLPFEGLRGWLLQSDSGQVLFNESEVEVSVPEHSHGDQYGIVIAGEIDLTIGGRTRTFRRGDTYFIPGGTGHGALIRSGFRAVDYFSDWDRYRPRPKGPQGDYSP
jgi:hypothetical protein